MSRSTSSTCCSALLAACCCAGNHQQPGHVADPRQARPAVFCGMRAQHQEQILGSKRQNFPPAEGLFLQALPESLIVERETIKRGQEGLMNLDRASVAAYEVQLVTRAQVCRLLRRARRKIRLIAPLEQDFLDPANIFSANQDVEIAEFPKRDIAVKQGRERRSLECNRGNGVVLEYL